MLRAARELLAVRSPLDAELMVSELLGTWWGQQPGRAGMREARRRRADIEELVGEGLVAYAAEQGSPAALALLSGIACLGTPRQCAQAEQAALELMERGVARPGWADHVGAVEAAECYVNSDAYGDRDEVVCVFSYAGAGAARPGRGRRLHGRRAGPRRLGHLPGRQAAGVLPRVRRGAASATRGTAGPAGRPPQRASGPASATRRSPRWSPPRRGGCWRPRWPRPRTRPTRR